MSRIRLATFFAIPLIAIGGAIAYAHQDGGMHHGPMTEQSMEMHLDHMSAMLTKIGASDAQKSQVEGILKSAFTEMQATQRSHHDALGKAHDLLLAPSVDRSQIEAMRAEQIRSFDEASKRMVTAFEDAAEVLSPEQRAALAAEVRKHHGG
jgi:Spy/CpxP family protein refolding chaperone